MTDINATRESCRSYNDLASELAGWNLKVKAIVRRRMIGAWCVILTACVATAVTLIFVLPPFIDMMRRVIS